MEIVKTKGGEDKYLIKDVKMNLTKNLEIDFAEQIIYGKFKRLAKSKNMKRVFYRTCPTFGRRLEPFPMINKHDRDFLPKEFAGDVLLDSDSVVESVLLKFVLADERVIPVDEWYAHTKERISLMDELEVYEEVGAYFDRNELDELRLELENVILEDL